jgi:hypothetical protein
LHSVVNLKKLTRKKLSLAEIAEKNRVNHKDMDHMPAADHHLIGENLVELNQPIFLVSLRTLREQLFF